MLDAVGSLLRHAVSRNFQMHNSDFLCNLSLHIVIIVHSQRLVKNTYKCTTDQEMAEWAETAEYVPGSRYMCTQQMAALFVMTVILNI